MNGVQGKDKLEPIPAWQRPAPVRSRSKRRRVLWGLVILALIGTVAWVIFRPQVAPAVRMGRHGPGGAAPVPVMAAAAEKGDIAISLNALGTVTPLANVTVKTQIAGQLTEVAFQEGQRVKAGDFLAQVDPRPYQLSLTQYQGQLQRDQALLKDAEVNLARYRTLIAQDSIARQTLDTQDALVEQYRGTVETDKALVDTAKLNLIYCHITAPVGGRVGLRQVDPGNYVQNSDSNGLVVITQLQPITVLFTVPEDNLPAVMKRLKEGGVLPVAASDRTQTAKLASGRLVTVDNQIDTTTGTIKMRAQFDNADEALFPNQFVNVQLLVDTLKDATVVPAGRDPKGRGRNLRLCGQGRQHRHRAAGENRTLHGAAGGDRQRPRHRRKGRDRRRRQTPGRCQRHLAGRQGERRSDRPGWRRPWLGRSGRAAAGRSERRRA